jgi:outer membrane immunogenic protein
MRTILLAGAAAVLASVVAANAADLQRAPPVMPSKAPPFVAPPPDWTGFYIGGNGGGGWGRSGSDLGGHMDTSGGVAGGTAGYNAQLGNWVLGVEGDLDWSNIAARRTRRAAWAARSRTTGSARRAAAPATRSAASCLT